MNFYLMFYQLTDTVERMETATEYLTAHALRISPRDSQATRGLLGECGKKLQEIEKLLTFKSHVSKVQVHRMAILFEALEIAHQRVLSLAELSMPAVEEEAKALWELLCRSRLDHQLLTGLMNERMGFPLVVALPEPGPETGLKAILQKEGKLRDKFIKLMERGIQIFDEEREMTEKLTVIRKNLLESKKYSKQLLAIRIEKGQVVERREIAHVSV